MNRLLRFLALTIGMVLPLAVAWYADPSLQAAWHAPILGALAASMMLSDFIFSRTQSAYQSIEVPEFLRLQDQRRFRAEMRHSLERLTRIQVAAFALRGGLILVSVVLGLANLSALTYIVFWFLGYILLGLSIVVLQILNASWQQVRTYRDQLALRIEEERRRRMRLNEIKSAPAAGVPIRS